MCFRSFGISRGCMVCFLLWQCWMGVVSSGFGGRRRSARLSITPPPALYVCDVGYDTAIPLLPPSVCHPETYLAIK